MSIMETVIEIPAEHEKNIFGSFDAYIKKIERNLNVTMVARDGSLKLVGEAASVKTAESILMQLLELSRRGNTITEQNVDYALALSMEHRESELVEIDSDIVCRTIQGKPIKPKTTGQKKYVDADSQENDRVWRGAGGNRKDISCDGNGDRRHLNVMRSAALF